MEHSKNYAQVNKYYHTIVNGKRLWTIGMVRQAVVKRWITADEYQEITGEPYMAEETASEN